MACLRELLRIQLRKLRAGTDDPRFLHAASREQCLALPAALAAHADAPLVVVVVELLELLRPHRPDAGATFTFVALVTGSLWGKPMWGTYWVWDARLTSMLVLFLLYLGLIALWQSIEEPGRAGRAAAILAIVGFVNVPIIKFSVDWWNTLHQPASIFRVDGPTIDSSLLAPLLVMAIGFTLLFVLLHLIAMRAEILKRRVHALRQMHVERAAAA
jgi:heme exporter protein CcmC